MDSLKKLWPLSFKVQKGDVSSLVVILIVFLIICAIGSLIIGVLGALVPFLGIVWWGMGSLLDLYGFIGIILSFVRFFSDQVR